MSRNIGDLHPRLQAAVRQLQKRFPDIGIGECYRTVAEQNALYAKGRTKPGRIVTKVRGSSYSSQHQWGVAVDFFYNKKGQAYSNMKFFREVGAYAKKLGLGWGGDWRSFKDYPHLYLKDWGSGTSILKRKYGSFANFKRTWKGASVALPTVKTKKVTPKKVDTSKTTSIITYLNAKGIDSSKANRAVLAKKYGVSGYNYSGKKNLELLNKMRSGSSTTTTSSSSKFYKEYKGTSKSIDTILKACGVPSKYYGSWKKRTPVAKANGIQNYRGKASQNTSLVARAYSGTLRKVK